MPLAQRPLEAALTKGTRAMIKTLDLISEAVRNPKATFRKIADRPRKAEKHRYERRKVKEFLKLGDWNEENAI